ncbi:MAG: hypothetical protein J5I65_00700 [Aridibacter famidurans]|nr:hypothetical protein [Aridibacter famidurans]
MAGRRSETADKPLNEAANGRSDSRFVLLSTSLLVDRVFLFTGLVDTLSELGDVEIWASSREDRSAEDCWKELGINVETFPEVRPFREFPHNYLRRLNEFVWDYRFRPPSRMSMMKHRRIKDLHWTVNALRTPAKVLAATRTEARLEKLLERFLLTYPRSEEALGRLTDNRPEVVVSTGPFQYEQPAVFSAAKALGIPTMAYIPSWDNVSTKNRLVFDYDGYLVWNERTKEELLRYYPSAKERPIYVVGAPQFDVFRQQRFHLTREEFCFEQGLDPDLPIIVYAIGSPNFLNEPPGAEYFAKQVEDGELGDVQLLIRPHPIHDNGEMKRLFGSFGPRVRFQPTPNAGKELTQRTQDDVQIAEWVNTFRHADVVINLSSTVSIDAALCDSPVVNLDFDPQPGRPDQQLIKEINHEWDHFKPIAESGGVWLVNDFQELKDAVKGYLQDPSLHRKQRRWIADYVCGFTDGNCGERMAKAIADFAGMVSE